MYRTTFLSLLLLGWFACLSVAQGEKQEFSSTIKYLIALQRQSDRTNLTVTMQFTGSNEGTSHVELPRCRFGTPDLWNSISELSVEGATSNTPASKPWLRIFSHEPNAIIKLKYTVSWDPSVDTDLAYRPDVSPTHFHFFGSQWRARLKGRKGKQHFQFEFADVPDDWKVFSNLGDGPGPYHVESVEDELSAFVAGGKFESARFDIKGTPVAVYVLESFHQPKRVVKATQEIIQLQGEMFGEFKGDFYLVSVIPRSGIRAGTAIDNAFVCLADADTNSVDLDILLAHEVFHKWLPHTGTIDCWRNGSEIDEFRLDWFVEGFTEYVARKVLLDSKRITIDDFVNRFNIDLREQALNPQRRASLAVVREALKDHRFTNRHERTSYFRGPLIALNWEHQLAKNKEHTVVEVVQEFVKIASESGGKIDESTYFDLLEKYGIDARRDYRKHIVFGDPPIPHEKVFEEWGYYFVPTTFRRYEQGFDVLETQKKQLVAGVVLDGPAYQAGLRDGMILVEQQLANKRGELSRLTVVEDDADEAIKRSIEFHPTEILIRSAKYDFQERSQ